MVIPHGGTHENGMIDHDQDTCMHGTVSTSNAYDHGSRSRDGAGQPVQGILFDNVTGIWTPTRQGRVGVL
jgi:hypothetical protein